MILPVRNGGAYLVQAVISILEQTHHRLELLLVDDNSDDGALAACPLDEPRLRVLSSPGQGVVDAFNHGLEQAQGSYVARMDADDIALPKRIEKQLALLESEKAVGICGTGVEFFPTTAVAGGNLYYQSWLNRLTTPDAIHRQMFIESPIPNPTAMFRRQVIDDLGGYSDTSWPEDYDLFLRADKAGVKMAKTDEVLLRWREHDARLTKTDERYARTRFQQAKAYFLSAGRLGDQPFLIWGGGPSGAEFYDLLLANGRKAEGFLDVHPRRIGGLKRGQPVMHFEQLPGYPGHFILIAVGSRKVRTEIRAFLNGHGRREGSDYLFVA